MRFRSIAIALTFLLATALLAHHGPKTITIKAAAKKQPAVVFDHAKHSAAAKSCDSCHHTQKGLTAANDKDVKACTTCHLDPKDPKTPSMREMSMAKNPFHQRCVDCHKAGKKGPTACTGCHKK